MAEYLDLDDLLLMVDQEGIGPVRDAGLLESAVARPRATAFGQDAYPTLWLKAAALLDSVVNNHALVDGNKRLGLLAVTVFLGLDGYEMQGEQRQVADLVLWVAEGRATVLDGLAGRLEAMARVLP